MDEGATENPYQDQQLKAARNHNELFLRVTDDVFRLNYERVRSRSMTSLERLYDLSLACRFVNAAGISGAIVEVGTWKGGALGIATLENQASGRLVVGFDTFEGHLMPAEFEVDIRGHSMLARYREAQAGGEGFAAADLDECRAFLNSLGKPESEIVLVKGDVKETIQAWNSLPVSILRIDCDWYQETLSTLQVLWPNVSSGGVVIFDDYGHMPGQKQAVDEFFAGSPVRMSHVDYSCAVIQKMN